MNEKPLKVNAYSCYMFCHGFLIQSRVHKVERIQDVWFLTAIAHLPEIQLPGNISLFSSCQLQLPGKYMYMY